MYAWANHFCKESVEPPKPPDATSLPDADQDVGSRLKSARDERGFTQGAVANRTKMIDPEKRGISRTAIIGYEQSTSKPGLREIKLLCEVLRISPNWLIYGTDTASVASQPSMELLSTSSVESLESVMRTALALAALKGHERDALQSLVLSLAGRQLGDIRLSGLLSSSWMMRDAFLAALKDFSPDVELSSSLEELAEQLSQGYRSNVGNRFKFDDEGQVVNEAKALYPDPKPSKF